MNRSIEGCCPLSIFVQTKLSDSQKCLSCGGLNFQELSTFTYKKMNILFHLRSFLKRSLHLINKLIRNIRMLFVLEFIKWKYGLHFDVGMLN